MKGKVMKRELHMKMRNVMVWAVLMACVCFVEFSYQASAVQVGPDVIDRPLFDCDSGYTYLDPNPIHAIPITGEISAWYLWAENSSDGQLFKLQVFRPMNNGDYQLIGQNFVSIANVGYNTIAVQEVDRIDVQGGDILGFTYHMNLNRRGVISFDDSNTGGSGQELFSLYGGMYVNMAVGDIISGSNLRGGDQLRTYSLAADVTAVPDGGATGMLISMGFAGLAVIRRLGCRFSP
jgi:hypothetical protein